MITYNTEYTQMPSIDQKRITTWVRSVARAHGKATGDINYVFVNDERILEVNRKFLSHDYYTDIITFDYTHQGVISGDIYISLDTIRTNADMLNQPYERELLRVIIHGILHLCGINDKSPGEREGMEAAENTALSMWDNLQEEG